MKTQPFAKRDCVVVIYKSCTVPVYSVRVMVAFLKITLWNLFQRFAFTGPLNKLYIITGYQLSAVAYASVGHHIPLGIGVSQCNMTDILGVLYARRTAAKCQQPTVIPLFKEEQQSVSHFSISVSISLLFNVK